MEHIDALVGLGGVLLGGIITYFTSRYFFRKMLEQEQLRERRDSERETYADFLSAAYNLYRAMDNLAFLNSVDAETANLTEAQFEKEVERVTELMFSSLDRLFGIQSTVQLFADKEVVAEYNTIRAHLAAKRQNLHAHWNCGPQEGADMANRLFKLVNILRRKLCLEPLPDLEGPFLGTGNH